MERDANVQDASFIDQLSVLEAIPDETNAYITRLSIRFSNFGKLFTLSSCLDPIPEEYPLAEIVALIESFDWTYIPVEDLGEQYDGKNKAIQAMGCSWWIRFFDYL